MSTNRHRRTRIYGVNFDIGESYYKKQLDELNNKSIHPRIDLNPCSEFSSKDEKSIAKVSFASTDSIFEDYKPQVKSREPSRFKHFNNTENDDVNTTHLTPQININDDDIDDFISKVRNTKMTRKAFFDELDDDLPLDFMKKTTFNQKKSVDNDNSYVSRFLRNRSSQDFNDEKKVSVVGSKLKSIEIFGEQKTKDELAAFHRAQETKARLLNLETEMEASSKKHNEREKRKETLKKYLISSGVEREKSIK